MQQTPPSTNTNETGKHQVKKLSDVIEMIRHHTYYLIYIKYAEIERVADTRFFNTLSPELCIN